MVGVDLLTVDMKSLCMGKVNNAVARISPSIKSPRVVEKPYWVSIAAKEIVTRPLALLTTRVTELLTRSFRRSKL